MNFSQNCTRRITPGMIHGCRQWYKSDLSLAPTTTLDTSGSLSMNNWAGALYLRGVSNGTKANQPLYTYDGKASKPILTFDGTNDILTQGSNTYTNAIPGITVFYVCKNASTATTANQRVFTCSTTTGTVTRLTFNMSATVKYQCNGRRLDADTAQAPATANNIFPIDTWYSFVGCGSYGAATGFIWINGVQVLNSTSWLTAGVTDSTDSTITAIGGFNGAGFLNGSLLEWAMWPYQVTDLMANKLNQYAQSKYGVKP